MNAPVNIFSFQISLYKLIQHISTIIGGIMILIAIYKMPAGTVTSRNLKWPYWFIVTGVALLIIAFRLLFGLPFHQYWNVLVTAISGTIIGLMIAPVFVNQ